MNDLERDLRELFEHRATDVDVPGLAPKTVLQRGRRRQVGTVVTGVLACLVALGVTAAAVGHARHPAVIPGGGNGLPVRTTSIGGVPVTAPAGWTLVDDYPLAATLATTSQSCSFTATGTAIPAPGSTGGAVPSATPSDGGNAADGGSQTGATCTTQDAGYAAGVPILQLANFAIPLTQTVCGLADQQPPAVLPSDGVAVYVGAFPGGVRSQALLDACPGTSNVRGEVLMTFADTGANTAYAAVAVAGPSANPTDVAVAEHYLQSLDGFRVDPASPHTSSGPGYVMAAGHAGETQWRLEAGLTSLVRSPNVGASIVVSSPTSSETSRTVDFATGQSVNDDAVALGSDAGVVQFGTATADVSGVEIALASGGTVPATLLPWPAEVSSSAGIPSRDGSVWFAETSQRGEVRAFLTAGQSSSPTSTPTAPTGEAGQLNTRQTANGEVVIYGHDLGHDWEIRPSRQDGAIEFFVDGAEQPTQSLSFDVGLETQVDVSGGTFLVALLDPTVQSLGVTTDATGTRPSTTIEGRWAPVQDLAGAQARVWLVPLPGSGTGTEQHNNDLPTFDAWPTQPLHQGSSFSSMSDGNVAWTLRYQNDHCVQLVTLGADSGNSGTSQCLPPWQDLGNDPMVGGVYGSTRATIALVLTHRPATSVTSPDLNRGELQCVDVDVESNFAGTTFCVFPVPVGQSVTLDLAQRNGPANLNQPLTVTARAGSIELGQSRSATAAASP